MLRFAQAPEESDFSAPIYEIYNSGKRMGAWEYALDWESLPAGEEDDPDDDPRWVATSLSAHVEQIGLWTAAMLLQKANDFPIRLALAQAAADEARHAEVFAKYAIHLYGYIDEVQDDFGNLIRHFRSLKSFDEQFLSHIALENLALEEFALLGGARGCAFLSNIYAMTRRDEARHVAMGIAYFRNRVKQDASLSGLVRSHLDRYATLIGVDESGVGWLADFSGLPADDVGRRINARQARLAELILSKTATPEDLDG